MVAIIYLLLVGSDRALLVWMTRLWPSLIGAAQVVQPETILRWHCAGWKAFWRWKSRKRAGRPKIDRGLRDLIRRISDQTRSCEDVRCLDRHPKGSIRLSLSSIRPSIGTKNPIPEEMDHREIAVRVPVMNEMQFLFPSEPCKSLKPRSLYVVFLVEKDMRVERRRARD